MHFTKSACNSTVLGKDVADFVPRYALPIRPLEPFCRYVGQGEACVGAPKLMHHGDKPHGKGRYDQAAPGGGQDQFFMLGPRHG